MKLTLPRAFGSFSPRAFAGLSERDRRLLLCGAAAAVLLLVFGLIVPLNHSVTRERARLLGKRNDLAWVQNAAMQLRDAPQPPAASGESLLVIIDRSARESGLAGALAGSEPGAAGSLSIRLEKANFEKLVIWLARLSQQNGVLVDSATIDKAGAPGIVNAAIVLHAG
jgi:general secretion pathway protein M